MYGLPNLSKLTQITFVSGNSQFIINNNIINLSFQVNLQNLGSPDTNLS